jgi:cystathionine gamma-synthase
MNSRVNGRTAKPGMRDLLNDPLWQSGDLGQPIPDSPHAVSTALPLWEHAIGYEEGDRAVLDRLKGGYPRFVYHPRVKTLFSRCEGLFAGPGEFSVALPSRRTAEECAAYILRRSGLKARIDALDGTSVHAVSAPAEAASSAKAFWQHTGWVVSSRQAEAILDAGDANDAEGEEARLILRRRLADLYGASPHDVALFPSGMAAITTAARLLKTVRPGRPSVQFGFPYVDTLKLQEQFEPGTRFFAAMGAQQVSELEALLGREPISGVVTEIPANPLLHTPDLQRIHDLVRRHDALLVVDDTIATPINVDLTAWADVIVTSLTKYVNGEGNVFAGSLVINPRSPHHGDLHALLSSSPDETLWGGDAVVLEENSRDFVERVRRINATAEILCRRLVAHPAVEAIYHPTTDHTGAYESLRRPDGGHGGLLSILPRNPAKAAPRIYDGLRVSKGPSLGTNFTLACPYTILAHYGELEWAESCGVSRWLIRLSIGLEDVEDLWGRLADALDD